MPLTSEEVQLQPLNNNNNKKVFFSGENIVHKYGASVEPGTTTAAASSKPPLQSKCYSQPLNDDGPQGSYHPGIKMFRDKRFDSFKTWSGGLERQLSILRGKTPGGTSQDGNNSRSMERPPVDRYFDALEGPELETLRVCDLLYTNSYG